MDWKLGETRGQAWATRMVAFLSLGFALLVLISFVQNVRALWPYTMDDAFITFRYADNLVRGWGLTFNQDPPAAEGYSSLLWTLLMALPHLFGLEAVGCSKIFGGAFTLGTLGLLLWVGGSGRPQRSCWERWYPGLISAGLFLTFPFGPMHVVSGMETALAAFLYALATSAFLKQRDGAWSFLPLPFSCLLLGLTRPEANLFSMGLLLLALGGAAGGERRRIALSALLLYVLPGVLYVLWRIQYYGQWFPLGFYLKSNTIQFQGVERTLGFLADLSVGFALPLIVLLRSEQRGRAVVLLPLVLLCLYFLTVKHIMGFGYRFLFPLVPVLALLAGSALAVSLRPRRAFLLLVGFSACLGAGYFLGQVRHRMAARDFLSDAVGGERAHARLGRSLAAVPWTTTPLLAIGDAGAVPYYSRLKTLDIYGLNTPSIALASQVDHTEDIFAAGPTVLVLASCQRHQYEGPFLHEQRLFRAANARGYRHRLTYVFDNHYFLWVLWHPEGRDTPLLERQAWCEVQTFDPWCERRP